MKIKNYINLVMTAVVGLAIGACTDDFEPVQTKYNTDGITADMVVNGDEQYYIPPADSKHGEIKAMQIIEGDFLMKTKDNRLYVEQNDDRIPRKARFRIVYADGYWCEKTIGQTNTRSAAVRHTGFLHNYGVGYSYDAIHDKYCSIEDIKCQILNRAVIDQCEEDTGEELLYMDYEHSEEGSEDVYYSKADYLHECYFTASADASFVLIFSASAKADMGIAEHGKENAYTLKHTTKVKRGTVMIDDENLSYYVKEYPQMLTSSFRNSIKYLKSFVGDKGLQSKWEVAVDSFLTIYGTHVVTNAVYGGKIDINLELSEKDYWTVEQMGVKLEGELLKGLAKGEYSSEKEKVVHKVLNNSKCKIDIVGGDVSKVDALTAMSIYQVEVLAPTATSDWIKTVTFSDKEGADNNSELIDMEVAPIWNFISDPAVADMVRARVEGNVDALIRLLGNRNFINTTFRMPSEDVSVPYTDGNGNRHEVTPDIIDIIYAGRHVAAICKELIPEIDTTSAHWVIYPIYEGKLLMESGICVLRDGTVYKICWNGSRYLVEKSITKAEQTSEVFITAGVPSFKQYENVSYEHGEWLPDIEMEHPINPDGSFNNQCHVHTVWKHFGHFYLNMDGYDLHQVLTGIPNWSYQEKLPQEFGKYQDYFDESSFIMRMVRNEDYRYVYNPLEAQVSQ